jgi:hypothetical protein
VDEWVAVVVLYLSELVTGSVDLRAVDITTLRRTSAVSDVALAVQVQRLWLTLATLLQWRLLRATAWDLDRWQELLAPVHSLLLLASVLLVVMAVNTSAVLKALLRSHQVSEVHLVHTLDL